VLKDKNGIEVKVNSYVTVVSLNSDDFAYLGDKELSEVMSIVGETLQVNEIDEYAQAWITKERWLSENDVMSHSVALSSNEMEIQPYPSKKFNK